MRKLGALILVICSVSNLLAQNDLTDKSLYHDTYIPETVVDPTYGITQYEPLNRRLGGDSIRNMKTTGYAATGFVEDYYSTGQLLHKGFYENGQLKIYKNYYPNGNMERNFREIDVNRSKLTTYYENGQTKSDIVFIGTDAFKWEDYYENGQLEYVEEYHKSFEYYTFKAKYFENGTPEHILELDNKKKLEYTQAYYHKNGNLKEQGKLVYNKQIFDYQKIGVWVVYDENGNAIKEQKYTNGSLHSEKNL